MKKIAVVALAAAVMVSLFSCAKKETSSKFILGLDDSFPPLGFRNESDEIVGYDIDLAREVTKRLGLELVCQLFIWIISLIIFIYLHTIKVIFPDAVAHFLKP